MTPSDQIYELARLRADDVARSAGRHRVVRLRAGLRPGLLRRIPGRGVGRRADGGVTKATIIDLPPHRAGRDPTDHGARVA